MPLLDDCKVKPTNVMFYGGRKHTRTRSYEFDSLYVLEKSSVFEKLGDF